MKNNSKEVVLEFDLPEFNKNDIKIKLSKNTVQIKAEKKMAKKIQKKNFLHAEHYSRGFSYATTLPTINPKKAKIEFKKGKLKIKVPKVK